MYFEHNGSSILNFYHFLIAKKQNKLLKQLSNNIQKRFIVMFHVETKELCVIKNICPARRQIFAQQNVNFA